MTQPTFSLVLPVYNQADHVGEVVEQYSAVLERIPNEHEIVLVPNGCRDASVAVCEGLARERPTVRVQASEQGGWGRAVKLGLSMAKGDLLGYTNSARTSAEDLLLLTLYAIVHPTVVLKANRKIRESWQRRFGSLLYNLECRALFDLSNWDVNGTPKIFPRTFTKLLHLTRDDDLIDAEFDAICRREGYPMLEVPIFSARRHGGRSTTGYRSALRMYWGAYQLWRSMGKRAP
ncbi:MAG TPA: glycosyltransferase [Chloroflexota bacterium]|jgi:glycosyltransferase involved in cell wall biosynthesis